MAIKPVKIASIAVFAASKEYRALLGCTVNYRPTLRSSNEVIDPGYTPPFDKSKLDTRLRSSRSWAILGASVDRKHGSAA